MKFVLVSNSLTSVKNFRTDILLDIQNKGYEIHILAPDFKDFETERLFLEKQSFILHEISLQRTGTNPIADFKTVIKIYQVLRSIKADVVLGYTIKPIIYGTIAAHFAKVPKRFALVSGLGFAFQEHTNPEKLGIVKKIVNTLYKTALKRATKVFFQNSDDKELLQKLGILNVKTQSVIVNGSGVNTEHFYQAPLQKDELGNVKVSFLMVARLLKDKGIREYFEAARFIKRKYPNTDFNLVGWIDENPAAISQKELDDIISENIINYFGKLSDVRPAIEQSSIFVLPSYREGVPRSVLEAMSMGRAIITTDAPGCKETVVDGVNGYKVNVASVDSLVDSMSKLVENPELIAKMGKSSRGLVLEKFDVVKVNHHMISEMYL